MSVFITDQGFLRYHRGLLPSSNPVDVFKYSLASLSVINWSHVIIYYDLDTNYRDRRCEMDQYIRSLFPEPVIYPFRNERQSQWKVAVQKVLDIKDDNLVWFCCNHDHIFVDYETDLLRRIEVKLVDLTRTHEYVSCSPSHWPEMLFYGRTPPRFTKIGVVEEHKDYFMTLWPYNASMQIVNKNLLHYWWFEHDYGDAWMPRTDTYGHTEAISPETACIIPYRELVRHFDGYSHNHIDINACPPLFIPDGFFENEIRISYCSDRRIKGYVSVNPLKKSYTAVDSEGADLKCVLEDLPLFWRSRIAQVEIARHVDEKLLLRCRDKAVLKMAWQKFQLPITRLADLKMASQKIQLPVTRLEVALRFNDPQNPPKEVRRLEYFSRSEVVTNKRAWLRRGLNPWRVMRFASRLAFRAYYAVRS